MSQALVVHARQILEMPYADLGSEEMRRVSRCRAVSAAYYGLFHHINEGAVSLLAPNVPASINHRVQRWFEHSKVKVICGHFAKDRLEQPLLGLVGGAVSPDLQTIARSFIELQDARHRADYDLSYDLSLDEAQQIVEVAVFAMASWDAVASSAEANIFVLSLLLWDKWDDKRRK